MILKTELQQHQVQAVEKLQKIKIGALYMEMGTGKTRTAIELIYRRLRDNKVNHILWLCPCSAKPAIEAEIKKHIDGEFPVTISGIESLSSSIKLNVELLELVQNKNVFLIVDESNLVKNHKAIRTENILRLSEHCKYKLILNGTPLSKNEKDLYSQWKILDWRVLGYKSFWSFANNHLEYDERRPGRIKRTLNVDYLIRKISPYTFQVKKSECLDLPEKMYDEEGFCLTREQQRHYEEVKMNYLMLVDELKPSTIYRLFTALQHVVSGNRIISKEDEPMRTEPMFKPRENPRIQLLLELLDRTSEKVIIWCKYTHEIKQISELLKEDYGKGQTVCFYGEVSKKNRIEAINSFSKDARFFVGNKTCAGYGLNLQFCSYAIYYTNDFDWATRSQSEDRIHRIGQDNSVLIRDIKACDTIDQQIINCLSRKESLVDCFKYYLQKQNNNIGRWIDGQEDI